MMPRPQAVSSAATMVTSATLSTVFAVIQSLTGDTLPPSEAIVTASDPPTSVRSATACDCCTPQNRFAIKKTRPNSTMSARLMTN